MELDRGRVRMSGAYRGQGVWSVSRQRRNTCGIPGSVRDVKRSSQGDEGSPASEGQRDAPGRRSPYRKSDVRDDLMEKILSGDLPPGRPLVERVLADHYRLSRTPIREVLRSLEQDRLVEVHPNQGVFVRKQSPKDIQDLFQLRIALEPVAASLAAHNRPPAELARLEDAFHRTVKEAIDDPEHLVGLGQDLHDAIIRWTGNHLLVDLYGRLRMQTRLVRNLVMSRPDLESRSFREHLGLLAAIEERNTEAARKRMRDHLERAEADIGRWLRSS